MSRARDLDLADIQGNIVRAHRHGRAAWIFLQIADGAAARRWLLSVVPGITTHHRPEVTLNIAFTHRGLAALGVRQSILDAFPLDVREGMAARAERLGDHDEDAPARWGPGPGTDPVDLMLTVYANSDALLAERLSTLERETSGDGMRMMGRQHGVRLAGGREHFGFVDGPGQPWVHGSGLRERPGQGTPSGRLRPHWRAVATGEFLLGHPNEEGAVASPRLPAELGRNGSFLVWRRLRQDVGAFRQLLHAHAHRLPGGEEHVAAALMGRWRNGTPLAVSPDRPLPDETRHPQVLDDFRYSDDPHGLRCPVGSHIRRANPRDGLSFSPLLVSRRRMIRRGMPYGERLAHGADDDGADRGLVFQAFVSDIARQFEFVQSQWLRDGNLFGLADERDPIAGGGGGTMTVPGVGPTFIAPVPRLVTVRGGEYFFAPGIRALRRIAEGAFGD